MKKKNEFLEEEKQVLGGRKLLAAMNDLDDDLVEIRPGTAKQMDKMQKRKRGNVVRWAMAAALSLCFLGGGIVLAASRMGWHIEKDQDIHRSNPDGLRYYVDYLPEKVSAEAFTGEVRKVEKIFREEAAADHYSEENVPRGWVKEFDTEKEAVDFVGFQGLLETALPDWETWKISIGVMGDKEGNIGKVGILGTFRLGKKMTVGIESQIYTTDWLYERMGNSKPFDQEEGVKGSEYITKNGKTALLIAPEYDGGFGFWMEGYFIDGAVAYSINVHYNGDLDERGLAKDAVEVAVYEWLDQF